MIARIVFCFILLSRSLFAYSQCLDTLFLGNDTTICEGQTLQLKAGPGYHSYYWNTYSTANSITINQTGNYWVKTTILDTQNLVVNGNFSQGNIGFTTDYSLGTGGSWGLLSYEETYAVSTNPNLTHTNFVNCGDHTSGTGNMMVVNGSSVLNKSIWCQNVVVTPNTTYIFSAWFTSVVSSNPAVLNFNINGNPIGGWVSVSPTTCSWQNFYQTWNSGLNTNAAICIKNQNTATSGNDFAIDDIYFAKMCTFYDTIHVDVLPYPIVNLGNDTTICDGDTILLNAQNTGLSYLWHDNTTQQTHSAASAGTYSVKVTNGPCSSADTIAVSVVQRPKPNLGPDTIFCAGTQISLDAGPGLLHIWNTNQYTQAITPDSSGLYTVKVYSSYAAECPGHDTILITKIISPELGSDTCIWKNNLPYSLSAGIYPPNNTYHWSNGAQTNSINITQAGQYSVTVSQTGLVSQTGCSDSKYIYVADKDNYIKSELGQADDPSYTFSGYGNQKICDHQSLRFTGPVPVNGSYAWFLNGTNVSNQPMYDFKNQAIGDYIVMLSYSNGCESQINVKVMNCTLEIPNIITPNGDGYNDYFVIKNLAEAYPNSSLIIYNRWGKIVFQTNNYNNDWDGRDNADGAYFWVLKLADGKNTEMNGSVTIIRQ